MHFFRCTTSLRSLVSVAALLSGCFAFAQAPSGAQAPATTSAAPQSVPTPKTPPAAKTPPAQQPGDAQQQAPTPEQLATVPTIKARVNEVNLIFTVTDKHGNFIKNLRQSDFALLDDRKPPEQVREFTQQTNLPLRVGLIIDASSSIRMRFKFEQDAASDFISQVLRPQTDKAFVSSFEQHAHLLHDFTNDSDALGVAIHKLQPAGGTALFDAIYTACRDQLLPVRAEGTMRKAIVVISDGDDNMSRVYQDDAVKMCQRAETIVYAISTNTGPDRDRGDDVLEAVALATGGRAFYPKRLEDMPQDFHSIEEELRSQYSLVYVPADFKADGSFRPIYLTTSDRKYQVRASKGYFTQKE
jgi:Ca-activated chloride channel family protein